MINIVSVERKTDKAADTLQIGHHKVNMNVSAFKFIDKTTKQHVIYIPALEMSTYGETKAKAEEMIKQTMDEFCKFLTELSYEERTKELQSLGWSKNWIFNKKFSRSYVDSDGNLKDFNAEENSIERVTLQAA